MAVFDFNKWEFFFSFQFAAEVSYVFKEVYSNMFAKYVEPPFEQHEIEVGSK